MSRIPLPSPDEMTPAQREVYQAIVGGKRGKLVGPLRAALHSPDLAKRWSDLGEFLRYGTCLAKACNELAILVTGRRWNAEIEFRVHAQAALAAGVEPAVVAAIRDGRAPVFADPAQAEVYAFAREIQQTGAVDEATYRAVERRWGVRGVVELTALVGYYTMVAMTLNAHCIDPVEGGAPTLPPSAGGLTDLPPA